MLTKRRPVMFIIAVVAAMALMLGAFSLTAFPAQALAASATSRCAPVPGETHGISHGQIYIRRR